MDPNETLRIIRLTLKQMQVDEDPGVRKAHAQEVAEHFEALDEWLTKGGFLPTAWRTSEDVIPWDLRLSFTPQAIREHFEGDDPDPTEGLTDEQLADVGRHALTDEGLYDAFHESLTWAMDSDETKVALPRQTYTVIGDTSNHNLPIGAVVEPMGAPEWATWKGADETDWYTQGGDGDEVAIAPADLTPNPKENG